MKDFYEVVSRQVIEREKMKASSLRKTPWWKQKLAQGTCHYCQKIFTVGKLTMDHVVPVARGGRSTKNNVVVSCVGCNQTKKLKTPAEMILESLEFTSS